MTNTLQRRDGRCEARCTARGTYREDYDAVLCDTHAEIPSYAAPVEDGSWRWGTLWIVLFLMVLGVAGIYVALASSIFRGHPL